jgi:hypothetical protein
VTFAYSDPLEDCESIIQPSPDKVLLRQIGRNVWDEVNEIPTDLAFGPQKSDARRPSFSTNPDAQASRDWHQRNASSPSLSVWAVTSQEVAAAGLRAVDDSECPEEPEAQKAPHHCYVDYRGLSKPEMARAKQYLLLAAKKRKAIPTADIGHHLAEGTSTAV